MKQITKCLFVAVSFVFALSFCRGLAFAQSQNLVKASDSDFDCEFIRFDKQDADNYTAYGCKELVTYTEEQAKTAGIPNGFSGEVISVVSDVTNRGITLDFSAKKIPTVLVDSITFRVYVGDDGISTDTYPEVRIPRPKVYGQWAMRYPFADKTDSWQEIVLKSDNGSFFQNVSSLGFNSLSKDGFLYKFGFGIRHNGPSANATFYIDSIKVGLVENDGVAPVISYNGADRIEIAKGQNINLEAYATDAQEGEVDVEYEWADQGVLDEHGDPNIGTHTLYIVARDYFGNEAKKAVTVVVSEPDTVCPTLDVGVDTVYAKIGAKVLLTFSATDDRGDVTITKTWSNGALDSRERLTEGTHTLTITATDSSGNKTEKTITFIVSAEGDSSGLIVDEEELFNKEEESGNDASDDSEPNESVSEEESDSESISEEESDSESVSEEESESIGKESVEIEQSGSEDLESKESLSKDSDEQSQSQEEQKKNGCGGELGGVGLSSLILMACAVFFRKKMN